MRSSQGLKQQPTKDARLLRDSRPACRMQRDEPARAMQGVRLMRSRNDAPRKRGGKKRGPQIERESVSSDSLTRYVTQNLWSIKASLRGFIESEKNDIASLPVKCVLLRYSKQKKWGICDQHEREI
uniref:Uncharacterized protein n=1 Tax=Ascaris lumbricoides TaxID=6252 RepID=A0A0M3HV57_ASCLU